MNMIIQCLGNHDFKPISCEYQKVYCMANVVFKARYFFSKTPPNMSFKITRVEIYACRTCTERKQNNYEYITNS